MKVFFCKRIITEDNFIYAENIYDVFNLLKILISFHNFPCMCTTSGYQMQLSETSSFFITFKEYLVIIGLLVDFCGKKKRIR